MAMVNGREVTTIAQAIKLSGVSRRTLYNWMAKGYVEYVYNAGGQRRVFIDTLWREAGPSTSGQDSSTADGDASNVGN